jgi:hypothetical protein
MQLQLVTQMRTEKEYRVLWTATLSGKTRFDVPFFCLVVGVPSRVSW